MIDLGNGLVAKVTYLRTMDVPGQGKVFGVRKFIKGERPLDNEPTSTIARLFKDDKLVAVAEASTKNEQFSRKFGRNLAIRRAKHLYESTQVLEQIQAESSSTE